MQNNNFILLQVILRNNLKYISLKSTIKNIIQVFIKSQISLQKLLFENSKILEENLLAIQEYSIRKISFLSIFFISSRIFLMFRFNVEYSNKILEKSFSPVNKNGVRVTWTARDALN